MEPLSRALTFTRRTLAGRNGALVVALVLALASMTESFISTGYSDGRDELGARLFLGVCTTLPLALVATRPRLAAAIITTAVTIGIGSQPMMLTVAGVVSLLSSLYLVATRFPRRWSVLFAAPFLLNAIAPFRGEESGRAFGFFVLLLVVAAQALGDSSRQRGEVIADRDATRHAMADTLREQAVLEERTRIARELHDVVAHHLSMIAVQAETGRHATPGLSELGQQRFEAIGTNARDALTEMRRLLGVMRTSANGHAERVPQPGLDRLSELADAARASGTHVRLVYEGTAVPLSPGVDLTAYRIVQEALTNARQHAPGAAVDVEVRYSPAALHLRVLDDGPGPSGGAVSDAGHGLLGMRERAAMVGGTLHVGPGPIGGFVVEATLPLDGPGAPLPPPRLADRRGP